MANNQIPFCEKAFQRLVDGNPNNLDFLGQTITAALVSKEAGLDPGYLKRSRLSHKYLIEKIDNHKKQQQQGGLKSKNRVLEEKLKAAKNLTESYKKQRDTFLTSAILLKEQVFKLENKIIELNKLIKGIT